MSFIHILIILIGILSVLLTSSYLYNRFKIQSLKECFVVSVLCLSAFILLSTEFLSLFSAITRISLGITWAAYIVVLIVLNKKSMPFGILPTIYTHLKGLRRYEIGFYLFLGFILLIVFVQGILYPPNNWDSMVYHLGRIIHWVQQKNVDNFPTHILRQVYQPPFAEYIILQLNILTADDVLSNSVQCLYLFASVIGVMQLSSTLGLSRKEQLLAGFFAITLPEALLQASSTQNDIVVSFFVIGSVIYVFKIRKQANYINFILLGICVALAVVTKATAYIFLLPFLIILAISLLYQKFWLNSSIVGTLIISLAIFLLLTAGMYTRNYQLSGTFLGTSHEESQLYQNQRHGPTALISNLIRNVSLHFGYPVLSGKTKKYVHKFLDRIGEDENDASLNFNSDKYKIFVNFNHEDYGCNLIHVILIGLLMVCTIRKTYQTKPVFYLQLGVIAQFILFCFLLKWQYWHTRLHTTLFFAYMPVLAYQFNVVFSKRLHWIKLSIIGVLMVYAFGIVAINVSRPLLPLLPSIITKSDSFDRYRKYFNNRPDAYEEYYKLYSYLNQHSYHSVGMIIDLYAWEYPLFSDGFQNQKYSHHIYVNNGSQKFQQEIPEIDCIISSEKQDIIHFNNKDYRRNPAFSKDLFLYEWRR